LRQLWASILLRSYLGNIKHKKGLAEWLRQKSTCLANLKALCLNSITAKKQKKFKKKLKNNRCIISLFRSKLIKIVLWNLNKTRL
jgi:hypothetical protein